MAFNPELPSWVLDNLSPIVLLIAGVLAILIACLYVKDKDSLLYKIVMVAGAAFGVAIVALAVIEGFKVQLYTLIIIAVAAFTLIIRPFREVHIAVIVGLLVMVLVYVALGGLAGTKVGPIDLNIIAQGFGRIILAFVIGALVYLLLKFAEALVKLFGTILNFWPILLILGILCVAEAYCISQGYGSIIDMILGIKLH